jgi:hypothetical protein
MRLSVHTTESEMNKAMVLNLQRLPLILMALLAASAMACSSAKTDDQGVDAVADAATDDALLGTDAEGTDATADVQGTDALEEVEDVPPQCIKGADCNDNDPCTDNVCTKGVCSNPQNGAPCDDGNPCTQNDFCKKGTCAGTGDCTDTVGDTGPDTSGDSTGDTTGDTGPATTCTDAEWKSTLSLQFVTDLGAAASTCAPIQGLKPPESSCVSPIIAAQYKLSDACSTCFGDLAVCAVNKCQSECVALLPGSGPKVTDIACLNCTAVNCGPALSTCTGFQAPDCGGDGDCDDKSVCTTDKCVNMFCTHTATPCDDGNACTTDSCDKTKGCQTVALPTSVTCDDGSACTEGDNCGTGNCVGTSKICNDNNPCTDDSCNLAGDCTAVANAVSCDDGVTCTTGDMCVGGACAGLPSDVSCGDGNPCTIDSCDAKNGCINMAVATTTACDDGNFCTVNDVCGGITCAGSLGTPCNDSNVCTNDGCNATAGNSAELACTHADIAGAKCDDGNSCTVDSCDPTNGCINNKQSNIPCDDGNAGTIGDTCTAGTCAGVVPECLDVTQCNDSKTCTTDSCDPVSHTCKHATNAGSCLIDGTCYADGKDDPANSCLACVAATSNNTWSNANESFTCGTAGTCASGSCKDPWPPTTPLANGKVCALPTCDASAKLPFFTGGNWTVTTKTVSTTCNAIIQLVEPQANVGYSKTGKPHPLNFVGGCDYAPGGTTSQVGTTVSNLEVGCEVKVDATYGVTSVQTSTITYAAGKGIGTGTATLYDLPDAAGQANNSCEIQVQVTVQHVPDCAGNGDCDDSITCTTDTCDIASGICSHTLAANTCLIGGQCIADGAYQGATGSASCRLCAGQFPSQYGWIILSSGEPCDDGNGNTSGEMCATGGQCVSPP